jgi:hypothetical protein
MRKLASRVVLAVAGLSVATALLFGQGGGLPPTGGCPTTSWDACEDCCEAALCTALNACPKSSWWSWSKDGSCTNTALENFGACLKSCPSTKPKW